MHYGKAITMSEKINNNLSPEAAKIEITERVKQHRILAGVTQEKLADSAMVSVRTVKRFEAGEEISLLNFLKILKALNLLDSLDFLLSDQSQRPTFLVEVYKPRKRVSNKKESKQDWKWGDEK